MFSRAPSFDLMTFIILLKPDIGFIVLFYDTSFRFASHVIGQSVPTFRRVEYLLCFIPLKCGEIKMKDGKLCWLSSCGFSACCESRILEKAHFPLPYVCAEQQK